MLFNKTLVIAPHADDEILGCGGTLLKRNKHGTELGWLLITKPLSNKTWNESFIETRKSELLKVKKVLNIKKTNFFELNIPCTTLDTFSQNKLINYISEVINQFKPQEIFLPHPGDIHSDHLYTFNASIACTKWFRHPFIKRVLIYETLSETEFSLDPRFKKFLPNLFIDIDEFIDKKLELMEIYKSELGEFPFPRSLKNIRALANLRGAQSGYKSAEAFEIIKQYE